MTPEEILQGIQQRAAATLNASVVTDPVIRERVDYVCRCMSNRAGVRLLMSCLLGKLDKPNVDPRKPYTEIGGTDSFSGRTYDERHLTKFINEHRLPVNPTTAFLTPTLRNIDHALTTDRSLSAGRVTSTKRRLSYWKMWPCSVFPLTCCLWKPCAF